MVWLGQIFLKITSDQRIYHDDWNLLSVSSPELNDFSWVGWDFIWAEILWISSVTFNYAISSASVCKKNQILYSCNKITTTQIPISRQNWNGFFSNLTPWFNWQKASGIKPKKVKKLASNSQVLTVQILTNDVHVLILCLFKFFTTVLISWQIQKGCHDFESYNFPVFAKNIKVFDL